MMLLFLAALLPALSTSDADRSGAVTLAVPRVEYRMNEAAATRSPWIDANGWRILRHPEARYYYDAPSTAAGLAAAEAFAYGANARIHTDAAGAGEFSQMLEFLRRIPERALPPQANIGVIDDGSDETGELMNLLSRRNLLYVIVRAPAPKLDVNVRIGSKEYPKEDAANPAALAQKIRARIGDEKRLLRIYGSEVVIARLLGDRANARVHLLNYSNRKVLGLRVRVLGEYRSQKLFASGDPWAAVADAVVKGGATEFTIPEMGTYAVIDLSQ
jgi:hypothetical protein